jgi:hypothetical protein
MSHEETPNGEAPGGPEFDESLPDAAVPVTQDPTVTDPRVPDQDPAGEPALDDTQTLTRFPGTGTPERF